MSVTFVSLFSGVGGFDLGLEAAGWECVAQVEWDKQCQAVLARHWPDVPRWGDVSTVNGADLPAADVIAFGSPCQDLSVAGKRAGLDGDRSGLFFEAIRIINEMREATDGRYPTWVIWENVGGALSSADGRDFGAVLDALAELGAVDIAWRVLDARFFGVPQRRRRVFVVGDFAGQRAGAVHAQRAGLPWHPRESRTQGPVVANGVGTSVATGSQPIATTDVIGTLSPGAHPGGFNGQDAYIGQLIPIVTAHTNTLTQGLGSGGPDLAHDVAGWLIPVTAVVPVQDGRGMEKSQNGLGVGEPGDPMYTLDATGAQAVAYQVAPTLRGSARTAYGFKGGVSDAGMGFEHEIAQTLNSQMSGLEPTVFVKAKRAKSPTDDETSVMGEVSPTLNSFDNAGDVRATVLAFHPTQTPMSGNLSLAMDTTSGGIGDITATAVRRLTPTECERLMGWPDDHTRWRADGTELADSTRYRMCGNGVASPVAEWLADMLNQAMENQ